MRRKPSRRKKVILTAAAVFVLTAGISTYLAADRFLIEHVEVDLSTQTVNAPTLTVASSDSSAASAGSEPEQYKATDMSYTSASKTITIQKVVAGSGNGQLVYYVADVQLQDGTDLKSAFAKNQYGTNIIDLVSSIAEDNNAILAINGDYYGFRDDGVIIRNGVLYRNAPAREGLAIYKDGSMKVYDETAVPAQQLLADGVWNTLSFGPALVKEGETVPGIDSVEVDTNFGNHSIQGTQPRTGIGLISSNHFVLIVADGRNPGYSTGVTMAQFADIFKDLGCTTAYNLDGGGSTDLVFMGKVINTPSNRNGQERGTSDILYVSR
jgi:exopolysaccharide biosynthesis protein